MIDTKKLREYAEKASKDNWGPYSSNIPFYAQVHKPRASLSKHDQKYPDFWHVDDAIWVAATNPTAILELLDELDELRKLKKTE